MTRLRVHALRFTDRDRAERLARQLLEDNPNLGARLVDAHNLRRVVARIEREAAA